MCSIASIGMIIIVPNEMFWLFSYFNKRIAIVHVIAFTKADNQRRKPTLNNSYFMSGFQETNSTCVTLKRSTEAGSPYFKEKRSTFRIILFNITLKDSIFTVRFLNQVMYLATETEKKENPLKCTNKSSCCLFLCEFEEQCEKLGLKPFL